MCWSWSDDAGSLFLTWPLNEFRQTIVTLSHITLSFFSVTILNTHGRCFKMWIPFQLYIYYMPNARLLRLKSKHSSTQSPSESKKKKNSKWGGCERREVVGSLVHVFHSEHHRHRGARDHSQVGDYQIHEIGRRHVVRQVEEAEWGHILPAFQVGLPCTAHNKVVRVIWGKINSEKQNVIQLHK